MENFSTIAGVSFGLFAGFGWGVVIQATGLLGSVAAYLKGRLTEE